jgi:hypothetical protein
MDEDGQVFNRNVPNDPWGRLAGVWCGAVPGTPVVFEAA